jgi:hypothetical protein
MLKTKGPPVKDSECRKDARRKARAKALCEWQEFLKDDRDWPASSIVRILLYKLERTRKCLSSSSCVSVGAPKHAKQIEVVENLLRSALNLAPAGGLAAPAQYDEETASEFGARTRGWERRLKEHFDWDWAYITDVLEYKLVRASAKVDSLCEENPKLGGLGDILLEAADLLRSATEDTFYLDWQDRKYGQHSFDIEHEPIKEDDGKVKFYELHFTYKGKPVPEGIEADERRRFKWGEMRQKADLKMAFDLVLEFAFEGWSEEAKKLLAKAFRLMCKDMMCWWD